MCNLSFFRSFGLPTIDRRVEVRARVGLGKGKGEKKEKKKKESKGKHYKSSSRSYANHVKCQPNILNMFDAYAIGCTSGCQTASNCVKLGFISGIEK